MENTLAELLNSTLRTILISAQDEIDIERVIYGDLIDVTPDQAAEIREKVSQEDLDEVLAKVSRKFLTDIISIHNDENLNYEQARSDLNHVYFNKFLRERRLGLIFPQVKSSIPPMQPKLIGDKHTRLIDALRALKLITKPDINSWSLKVFSHVNVVPKEKKGITDAAAEFAIANPAIFFLPNAALFKSNPTFSVLNSILKKYNMVDLSTKEGRASYIANSNYEALSAFLKCSLKVDEVSLSVWGCVNSLSASILSDEIKSELTSAELTERTNIIAIASYCAATITGTIAGTALVATTSELASSVITSAHPKIGHTLAAITNKAQSPDSIYFEIFREVRPFFSKEYQESGDVKNLDTYILAYQSKRHEIAKQLNEIAANQNNKASAVKADFFSSLIPNIVKKLTEANLEQAMEDPCSDSNEDKLDQKQITKLKGITALLQSAPLLAAKSTPITPSSDFVFTDDMINELNSGQMCINTFVDEMQSIASLKYTLSTALENTNYDKIIEVATQLKSINHPVIFQRLIDVVHPVLSTLAQRMVYEDNQLILKNIEGDITTEADPTVKLTRDIKTMEKKIRALEAELLRTEKKLSAKNKEASKPTEPTAPKKEQSTPIDAIERRFMFNESTTLHDAVAVIKHRFSYVVFSDDIEKQLNDCKFNISSKLLKSLYILANDYYPLIQNGKPDSVAKDVLPNYRANESDTVLNNEKLRRQRMFNFNGEARLQIKHMNISTARDNSCSVYFEINNDTILVGYIGSHLDNTFT